MRCAAHLCLFSYAAVAFSANLAKLDFPERPAGQEVAVVSPFYGWFVDWQPAVSGRSARYFLGRGSALGVAVAQCLWALAGGLPRPALARCARNHLGGRMG